MYRNLIVCLIVCVNSFYAFALIRNRHEKDLAGNKNTKPLVFISQIYIFGDDKFIEIKNKSQVGFSAGTYFLAVYNAPNDPRTTSTAPDSFIDIGAFDGLETKVFADRHAVNPQYAVDRSILLPGNFDYRCKSILILTTSTDNTAYANRIDLAGQFGYDTCEKSWVRSSCATNYPRTDAFDINDWVEFALDSDQLNNPDSMTNAILTTHHHEDLIYNFNGDWEELNLPNNSSLPDKSRIVQFTQDFNLANFGNLEVCSLILGDLVTVTVPPSTYVSSEISVTVNLGANLDIQNGGSLIMVKDSYGNVSGPDLVQLNNGTVNVTKITGGLDAYWDYVYWSSPLTANPINLPANSINNLFAAPRFDPNWFFGFRNHNWFDGFDVGNSQDKFNPGVIDAVADGYDDNFDSWYMPQTAERNGLMTPGQGYITWPPSIPNPNPIPPMLNFDYDINFNGQANNGVVEVPIFKNASFGWNNNLVGNPYPSSIDLNRFFEVNTNIIEPYAFIWGRTLSDPDPSFSGPTWSNYTGDNYAIYNPTMMVISPPSNYPPFNSEGILSSCQSFIINAKNNGLIKNNAPDLRMSAGTLIFNNSMRSIDTSNRFMRGSANDDEKDTKIWMSIKDNSGELNAQLGVAFLEKAKNEFDANEDVENFYGKKLGFYTKTSKKDLIIDAQNAFNIQKTIALGITNILFPNKKLFLTIDKKTGELANHEVFVFDKLTSKIVNISKENYAFESNAKIMDDRFTILFQNKIENEISDIDSNKVVIFAKDGVVTINSLTEKLIQSVFVADLYTPSVGGIDIAKNENINNKMFSFNVDSKYKLLNIKVILEDGTIINKKIIP